MTSIINIYHIFSDEEYEWEYIESDEENNQNAKADDKATVTLPTKVRQNSVSFLLLCSFSQAESLPNIAEKETSVYLNRNRFGDKEEETSTEGKRDKGSQEFIDISEVLSSSSEQSDSIVVHLI